MSSTELDYKAISDIPIQYSRQVLQPLSTITAIGQVQPATVDFALPNAVVNLSKKVLNMTLTYPVPTVGSYHWTPAVGLGQIQSLQLVANVGGQVLADVPMTNYLIATILRYTTRLSDLKQKDNSTSLVNMQGMMPCNVISNVNYCSPDNANATLAEPSYESPLYNLITAQNGTPSYQYSIPLSLFKHTLFAADKLVYFGQSVYLRLIFAPRQFIAAESTSAVNSTAGVLAPIADIVVSNLFLYTCQLKTTEAMYPVQQAVIAAFNSQEGLRIPHEFTYGFAKPNSGTSQPNQQLLNRSMGTKLKRVYYAIYNTSQANAIVAYDHRIAYSTLASYNSLINNNLLQDFLQTTANYSEYVLNKDKLKDSCIVSQSCWARNFVHIDDFQNVESYCDDTSSWDVGLSLDNEINYQWQCSTAATNTIHYMFAVVARTLVCSKDSLRLV